MQAWERGDRVILFSFAAGAGRTYAAIAVLKALAAGGNRVLAVPSSMKERESVRRLLETDERAKANIVFRDPSVDPSADAAVDALFFFDATRATAELSPGQRAIGMTYGGAPRSPLFSGTACVFSYTLEEAVRDGGLSFYRALPMRFELFCMRLFRSLGYDCEYTGERADCAYDLTAEKNGVRWLIECKVYRDAVVPPGKLLGAAGRPAPEGSRSALVVLGAVREEEKELIKERAGIAVWDLPNLLWLVGNDAALGEEIAQIVPYPLSGISAKQPFGIESPCGFAGGLSGARALIAKLKDCPVGKKHFADYEKLCCEILRELWGEEFWQICPQKKTKDELFRMDAICSLKGTHPFWKLLMTYYNTRFVVFEFKNYRAKIEQDVIFTTEKYLFPAALRNVAFIVSRHGFSGHARFAAEGCLKEDGKLLFEITDGDLCEMLEMKERGEDPSDFLLGKFEEFMMSIGK